MLGLVLPPDISQKNVKCPFNILFIFKILSQGTHLTFEFHLSFQKLREYQLIDSFSLLAEIFRRFFVLFFLLVVEYTGILLHF